MNTFKIDNSEYIELNKLLKVLNLVESGGEANARIDAGEVKVNAAVERQRRKNCDQGILLFSEKNRSGLNKLLNQK